jgi:hypothetical protein
MMGFADEIIFASSKSLSLDACPTGRGLKRVLRVAASGKAHRYG